MDKGATERTLLVLRHAKAEREPAARDAMRPLARRGERDAGAAGRWMLAAGLVPDLVLCSTALRTRQTWEQVRSALGPAVAGTRVSFSERMYRADAEGLLAEIRDTPDTARAVLLVGHNPAAHQLAADLTGEWGLSFPTAALAVIRLDGRWLDAAPGGGDLAAFWTPRAAAS